MKRILFFSIVVLSSVFISCRKDHYDNDEWYYNGNGDGNIDSVSHATINYTIESNLNVSGLAVIEGNTVVSHDLNLNRNGKVVIIADHINDTIYVNTNANIDDTLLVQRGILKVSHDFNINSHGVVNCSNDAQIIVIGSLNQAGTLWGLKNIKVEKALNINNKNTTYENPIPFYSSAE